MQASCRATFRFNLSILLLNSWHLQPDPASPGLCQTDQPSMYCQRGDKGTLCINRHLLCIWARHMHACVLPLSTEHTLNTYRVIQSINVQHHSFGPLVSGAQEELGFVPTGGCSCLSLLSLFTSWLQDLIDLRGQQFSLSRRCTPVKDESKDWRYSTSVETRWKQQTQIL